MKVLFLDIDGVLNSHEHDAQMPQGRPGGPPGLWQDPTEDGLRWCRLMLSRLRRIVARTDCNIVISSDWRKDYPQEHARWKWQQMFGVYGWTEVPVIGQTPVIPPKRLSEYLNGTGTFRGDEVRAWILEHGPLTAYAILDDRSNFHRKQPLVQTDPKYGLQDQDVERCIDILNKQDT